MSRKDGTNLVFSTYYPDDNFVEVKCTRKGAPNHWKAKPGEIAVRAFGACTRLSTNGICDLTYLECPLLRKKAVRPKQT